MPNFVDIFFSVLSHLLSLFSDFSSFVFLLFFRVIYATFARLSLSLGYLSLH